MSNHRQLLNPIESGFTDDEKIAELINGLRRYGNIDEDMDDQELSPKDYEIVKRCLNDPSPSVKEEAITVLTFLGPLTWQDLKNWLQDTDEDVRKTVEGIAALPSTAAGQLCRSDKERYTNLIADSWVKYPKDGYSITLSMLATDENEDGWLEPTWEACEKLWDMGNSDIRLALQCGYFEDVIQHLQMDSKDQHIRPWIEGTDRTKKCLLLEILSWLRIRDENLLDIADALTTDSDPEIACCAQDMANWKRAQKTNT